MSRGCIIEHAVGLCSLLPSVISSGKQKVQWGVGLKKEPQEFRIMAVFAATFAV